MCKGQDGFYWGCGSALPDKEVRKGAVQVSRESMLQARGTGTRCILALPDNTKDPCDVGGYKCEVVLVSMVVCFLFVLLLAQKLKGGRSWI